jgi:tRNA (mo5U34)-methyltransferase
MFINLPFNPGPAETELLRRIPDVEGKESRGLPLARLLNNLAVVYHAQGRFIDADVTHKRCASVLEALGDVPMELAQSLSNRAALYRTFEEYHEAERVFQLAVPVWDRHGWPKGDARWNSENVPDTLSTQMLWADFIGPDGLLRHYSQEVQELKKSPEALQRTIAKLGPWYHDIRLTPDISTYQPHRHYMENRWKYLSEFLPGDLSGKRVLDIGCNSGFFALQMKERNAREVVGIDIMPHCLAQSRFVSHWFGQAMELRQLTAYDVASLGEFDIVVFIGVLYHLRHPLYAIDKVASICRDTMYLQSMIRGDTRDFSPAPDYPQNEENVFKVPEFPRMYFIEKSLNGDESNWWVPNTSCLMAMSRSAGFRDVRQSSHPELIICRK